jgi:hypothetical protein
VAGASMHLLLRVLALSRAGTISNRPRSACCRRPVWTGIHPVLHPRSRNIILLISVARAAPTGSGDLGVHLGDLSGSAPRGGADARRGDALELCRRAHARVSVAHGHLPTRVHLCGLLRHDGAPAAVDLAAGARDEGEPTKSPHPTAKSLPRSTDNNAPLRQGVALESMEEYLNGSHMNPEASEAVALETTSLVSQAEKASH